MAAREPASRAAKTGVSFRWKICYPQAVSWWHRAFRFLGLSVPRPSYSSQPPRLSSLKSNHLSRAHLRPELGTHTRPPCLLLFFEEKINALHLLRPTSRKTPSSNGPRVLVLQLALKSGRSENRIDRIYPSPRAAASSTDTTASRGPPPFVVASPPSNILRLSIPYAAQKNGPKDGRKRQKSILFSERPDFSWTGEGNDLFSLFRYYKAL